MRSHLNEVIRFGLILGIIALFISLIGMVEAFSKRDIISGVISLGLTILLLTFLFGAYLAVRRARSAQPLMRVAFGAITGLTASIVLAVFVLFAQVVDLRQIFVNVTPTLIALLTFGQSLPGGLFYLLAAGAVLGALGAIVYLLPKRVQHAFVIALLWVTMLGVLQDLIRVTFQSIGAISDLNKVLYEQNGLSVVGALIVFALVAIVDYVWNAQRAKLQARFNALPAGSQRIARTIGIIIAFALLLLLPQVLGIYIGEVLDQVGLFVLMGLGLNIVVGFAGLLDLGYVAFFAIGAYTVGVLTSPQQGGVLSFWEALPIGVVIAILFGFILGIPVLKIRGDYLAIITLGFGEIIRLLALSDFLKPFLGGSQGIPSIPKAQIGGFAFDDPVKLYYLLLVGCVLVAFVALRLKDSRLGRAWMAIREDEDVAQAMGIDMVWTKLMAFAIGAAFAGISGAIFASKLSAIYPHSFKLDISINVLALLIIGGMGSIPGVIVGALALVGLPELLREFEDYRLLIYGATLVLMMQLRPEGLLPEESRRRELHEQDEPPVAVREQTAAPVVTTN